MEQSGEKNQVDKKIDKLKIFSVPYSLEEIKKNNTINIFTTKSNIKSSKPSKDKIINQAFKLHSQGKISEAEKLYQYFIGQGFKDYRVFSNYGTILKDLGKFKEAELYTLKAIELNPGFAGSHYNLGNILKDLGKLNDAELSLRKAIAIDPNLAEAHSNLGSILSNLGKLKEAESFTRNAIELNPDYAEAHYNLGNIMRDLKRLIDSESYYRKAIELNPDFAKAHSNLGSILSDLGKLKESELSYRKAIELDLHLAIAYLNLSYLKYSNTDNTSWQNKLFSESILNNKSQKDQINIYFARANILHKHKNYKESAKYLDLANKLKLDIQPSKTEKILNKSKVLLAKSDKHLINYRKPRNCLESIFIVGMFRSGSTLLESILSMNKNVDALGEINILEESFLTSNKLDQGLNLAEKYWKSIKDLKKNSKITTNKNLFNYQYTGIISTQIPNAKIIHCYRNPLDNILSIYRAHFAKGNEYSSSLVDSAKVYLDQEEIMIEYKNRFRSKIYDLNYDLLVSHPNQEIKSLISWLGWKWDNSYLTPHLNPRSVSTASNVQVRSPINSKSIGGWKNYKEMLKPAIKILSQTDKYQHLIY